MNTHSHVNAALDYFNQQRADETWQQKLWALENFNQQTVSELAQASPSTSLCANRTDCRHQWPLAHRLLLNAASPTFLRLPPPKTYQDELWSKGANATGTKNKKFRALMPYGLFKHIFANADIDHFIRHGGIKCYLEEFDRQCVYHIRYGNVHSIDWDALGGAFAEVKIVEFSLDYMRDMVRYQIYQPVLTCRRQDLRQQTARSLIDMWTEVVHSWTSAHALELPRPPWRGESEEHIPVVVWLKKQQLPDTPRGKKRKT